MTKRKLLPPVDWLQGRANEIWSECNENRVEEALYELVEYYDPLNYTINYGFPLWRERECEHPNGFRSISEVHYPPAAKAKVGRICGGIYGDTLLFTKLQRVILTDTGSTICISCAEAQFEQCLWAWLPEPFRQTTVKGQKEMFDRG